MTQVCHCAICLLGLISFQREPKPQQSCYQCQTFNNSPANVALYDWATALPCTNVQPYLGSADLARRWLAGLLIGAGPTAGWKQQQFFF